MIHAADPPQRLGEPAAIETATPGDVPRGVVLAGPLPLEQRFGVAVAVLLLPVGSERVPMVMPDERAVGEPQGESLLLQPPAHIDVVAGSPELRVESTNLLQRVPAERHADARDVLGLVVRQQHVYRPAGRVGHAVGHPPVVGNRDVPATDTGM